jgi:Domain of unknown function (DUF5655)/Domain of unknown function (DUF4287)
MSWGEPPRFNSDETSPDGRIMNIDQAIQTQLANIQKKTGQTLDQLHAWLKASGLAKHGELRAAAKSGLGLGHGDANTLVTLYLRSTGQVAAPAANPDAAVDEIYGGSKATLRPIHDRVMTAIEALGPFEIAPKKAYLSLRRKKQFAMVGPATKTQVEIGLNAKEFPGGDRLLAQKPGGMCQYKVRLASPAEVDAELLAWIRAAYDASG